MGPRAQASLRVAMGYRAALEAPHCFLSRQLRRSAAVVLQGVCKEEEGGREEQGGPAEKSSPTTAQSDSSSTPLAAHQPPPGTEPPVAAMGTGVWWAQGVSQSLATRGTSVLPPGRGLGLTPGGVLGRERPWL